MTTKTVLDVQSEIELALKSLSRFATEIPEALKPLVRLAPPKGQRASVSLRRAKTDRQVKRSAPADSWSPESGVVSISYEMSPESNDAAARAPETTLHGRSPQPKPTDDPVRDLLLALARAEQEPQLGFVSLKWFRDNYLPRQGYSWASDQERRQRTVEDAIRRNWVLTSKVPNPKNPQYPVTAINVNRPLAEVRQILDQEGGSSPLFAPLTIRGELLSETVLRERR